MARHNKTPLGGRSARSESSPIPPGGSIIGGSSESSDSDDSLSTSRKKKAKPSKRTTSSKPTTKTAGKPSGKPASKTSRTSSKSGGKTGGRPTAKTSKGSGRPSTTSKASGRPTGKPGTKKGGKPTGGPKASRLTKRKRTSSASSQGEAPAGERLQKVLAAAGYGSRRQCEELILEGRVEIDRKVIDQLGTRVDLSQQKVSVDGEQLARTRHRYFLVNKPRGVLSTSKDPAGRERVIDLVPDAQRVFTVGRLDKSSEGLILVTNDGELANQLTHPRYGIEKTYLVKVSGLPTPEELGKLRRGVYLAEGKAQVASIRIKGKQKGSTILEMVLKEGRNREIRRVLASLGHKVQRLERIAIGPVRLGDMPAGAHRELTREELKRLRQAVPKRPK